MGCAGCKGQRHNRPTVLVAEQEEDKGDAANVKTSAKGSNKASAKALGSTSVKSVKTGSIKVSPSTKDSNATDAKVTSSTREGSLASMKDRVGAGAFGTLDTTGTSTKERRAESVKGLATAEAILAKKKKRALGQRGSEETGQRMRSPVPMGSRFATKGKSDKKQGEGEGEGEGQQQKESKKAPVVKDVNTGKTKGKGGSTSGKTTEEENLMPQSDESDPLNYDDPSIQSPTAAIMVPGTHHPDLRKSLRAAGDRLVIILFYEDECEDCEAMRMLYEEFVVAYPDVLFLEANVQSNKETVLQLRLKFLPTFIAYRSHLEVGRLVTTQAEILEEFIHHNTIEIPKYDPSELMDKCCDKECSFSDQS